MVRYNLKKILIEEHEPDFAGSFYSKYDEMPEHTPNEWDVGDMPPEECQSDEWCKYQRDLMKHIKKTLYHHVESNPAAIHPNLVSDKVDWVDDFVDILEEPLGQDGMIPDLKEDPEWEGIYTDTDHITNSRARTWIDMFDNFYGPGTTKDKLHRWRSVFYSQDNTLDKWK